MNYIKKIFGEINLTWKKLIVFSLVMGVYTAIMAMLPIFKNTSFSDITVTFEVWILFGIIIILNSKSPLDSALKCFVFFLISQPLVYLIQDIINGSNLFVRYYGNWIPWTVACFPMGFFGYYLKKDKWWGLIILTPMLLILCNSYMGYLSDCMFSFPRHILTVLFCIATMFIYPIYIFKNNKIKIVGTVISVILIIICTISCVLNPPIYSTDILSTGKYKFDDKYKVYLKDKSYGDLSIKYEEAIETWMIHAEFKKAGNTEFILESPNGEKIIFKLKIKSDTYHVVEKK